MMQDGKSNNIRILNFGSMNLDYVYSVEHFVRAGETTSSQDMQVFCGGKGLNQSIALARAGATVYHAGAVGKADGKILLDELRNNGVNVELTEERDCASGHAIIQVDAAGQTRLTRRTISTVSSSILARGTLLCCKMRSTWLTSLF